MPTDQPLDVLIDPNIAEVYLQCVGMILLAVGAIGLTLGRRWAKAIALPAIRGSDFQPMDVLLALYAFLFFPMLFGYLLQAVGDPGATSQPAGSEASQAATAWSGFLGKSCAAGLLCWLGIRRMHGSPALLGLRADRLPRDLTAALLGYVAVWPLCAAILWATQSAILYCFPETELPKHEAIQTLLSRDTSSVTAALTIISAILLAPIVEELFFRGILQSALARRWRSQWRAIAVSATAFGLIHFQNVETVPALALFGAALGYAYAKSRSLTLVIALHALFNLKTMLWISFYRNAGLGGP